MVDWPCDDGGGGIAVFGAQADGDAGRDSVEVEITRDFVGDGVGLTKA